MFLNGEGRPVPLEELGTCHSTGLINPAGHEDGDERTTATDNTDTAGRVHIHPTA
jgi:hypothetical protein